MTQAFRLAYFKQIRKRNLKNKNKIEYWIANQKKNNNIICNR